MGRISLTAALLALLCLAAAVSGQATIPRRPVEFSPSVSIFFLEDMVPFADDPSTNQCIEMVKRASSFNSRCLNLMITWYFKDIDQDEKPDQYCFRQRQHAFCTPITADVLATYEAGLSACVQFAVDLGFDLFYTPHVDDGGTTGTWRNAVKVDPLVRLGSGGSAWTYKEIMLVSAPGWGGT
jgi:hypothetical protein